MKTTKFTATLGFNEWYNHENAWIQDLEKSVWKIWQVKAKEVFEKTQIYISAIVQDANAIYHTERWCPEWGEKIARIEWVRNPEFMQDAEKYKQAVIDVLTMCQEELKQTTAQVDFSEDAEFFYVKR